MSAAFVPSTWPAPAAWARPAGAAAGASSWRFGREVALSDERGATRALQWRLRRNCSISPRQMLTAFALLSAVSLIVGLGFWFAGAFVVLAFAGIELLVVAVAMLAFARHIGDGETLTLVDGSLWVERAVGPQVERAAFNAQWLTVEPAAGQNSLVQLCGQGQAVRVGRFLRPELRSEFAEELRRALRLARGGEEALACVSPDETQRPATPPHESR